MGQSDNKTYGAILDTCTATLIRGNSPFVSRHPDNPDILKTIYSVKLELYVGKDTGILKYCPQCGRNLDLAISK